MPSPRLTDLFSFSRIFPSPYSGKETIKWFWKNVVGFVKDNPGNLKYETKEKILNEIRPEITLGFIGDILDVNNKTLIVSPQIKDFFSKCNYLIGNLEGTITNKGVFCLSLDQTHKEEILDALAEFYPPSQTYLSVANNHSGDFSEPVFRRSIEILKEHGFHVFGQRENPSFQPSEWLRIITGTKWSNKQRGFDYVSDFDSIFGEIKEKELTIVYPHWGYELECFPRLENIDEAYNILMETHIDAIIGHHPHVPQPIIYETIPSSESPFPKQKLLAYSLGDFCFGKAMQVYQYGIILKIEVGPLKDSERQNEYAIGKVNWEFIHNTVNDQEVTVDLIDTIPCLVKD